MISITRAAFALLGCLLFAATAQAQTVASAPASTQMAAPASTTGFSTEQLEQIVAPIALYPDALLSQVLMASTYPLEIVEADRWVKKNPKLTGEARDTALKQQDWDASVKSLVPVPDVLAKMSENLDWTQDLGDAVLEQKTELMDTVQRMRGKAYAAGNLQSSEQLVVTQQPDQIIVIQQADPQVVYVPSYSPTVVYGPAWYYPTWYYPPMYYPPPPGYGLMAFGLGAAWGAAVWGDVDWGWGNSDIDIDIDHYNEFNRNTSIDGDRTRINANDRGRGNWQHDPGHRKGVNYRDQNTARQYGARGDSGRVTRDQARGRSTAGVSDRAAGGAQGPRDYPSAGTRDTSRPAGPPSDRTRGGTSASDRSRSGNSAMSGSSRPRQDRAASSRGSMSRGTSSFGGMRGGGMRGGGGRRR